jgi:hypothetical protein
MPRARPGGVQSPTLSMPSIGASLQDPSTYRRSSTEGVFLSLGHVAQVDVEPSSGGASPAASKCNLQVLLPVVAAQHQPDTREDLVLIPSRGIEVTKQAGVWRNAQPPLTQHAKVAGR